MTGTQEKIRALFLTALMVFSVFAGTVAFSGAAAAAANAPATLDKATHYQNEDGTAQLELILNNSDASLQANTSVVVTFDDDSTTNLSATETETLTTGNNKARLTIPTGQVFTNVSEVSVQNLTTGSAATDVDTDAVDVTTAPVTVDARFDSDDTQASINTTSEDVFVGTNVALILDGNTTDIVGPDTSRTRGPTSPSKVFVLDTDDLSTGTYNFTQAGSVPEAELELSSLGLEFDETPSTEIFQDEDVDIDVTTDTVDRALSVEVLDSDDEVVGTVEGSDTRINNQGQFSLSNVFDEAGLATPDTGNYTIRVTDINSGVTIESDTIVVSERPDADVGFTQSEFSDERGDVIEFTVTLDQTDNADVQFGSDDDGYNVTFGVEDNDGDGEVTVAFNTYNSTTGDASDAFSIVTDDDDDDPDTFTDGDGPTEENGVTDIVAATTYDIRVESAGAEDPALSAAVVEPRTQGTLNTWIAPAGGAPSDLEGVNDAIGSSITQSGEVASGDLVVLQLADVEGIEGLLEAQGVSGDASQFTNATKGTDTGNISLTLTQQDVDPNDVATEFDITENANVTGVISDKTNDTYYVVLDSEDLVEDESEIVFGIEAETNRGLVDGEEDEEINNTIDQVDPSLEITKTNVTATDEATVEGETNFAPGTEFRVRLQTTGNPSERFIESSIVTVQPDGTFTGTYDLADAAPGDEYDITIGNTDANIDDLPSTTFEGTVEAAQATPTPTPTATPTPTMGNMTTATATATPTPTATPTATPTDTPEPTDTPTDTPEPTDTPTDTPEPTATPTDEPTETPTETSTGTPGFTAVLGVVALLGAALVALRRRN